MQDGMGRNTKLIMFFLGYEASEGVMAGIINNIIHRMRRT